MPRCYLTLELLPDGLWPAFVHRADGRTLLTVDPTATRIEATARCAEILTEQEAATYSAAYREVMGSNPPKGCDDLVTLYVPAAIRLAGEQPTQGGIELLRRYEGGLMEEDLSLLFAEQLTG